MPVYQSNLPRGRTWAGPDGTLLPRRACPGPLAVAAPCRGAVRRGHSVFHSFSAIIKWWLILNLCCHGAAGRAVRRACPGGYNELVGWGGGEGERREGKGRGDPVGGAGSELGPAWRRQRQGPESSRLSPATLPPPLPRSEVGRRTVDAPPGRDNHLIGRRGAGFG